MNCLKDDDEGELHLIATVSTTDDELYEDTDLKSKDDPEKTMDLTNKESKWDENDFIDPDLLHWDLKDTLFISVKQCEQTHMEYARSGFDMQSLERLKKLAASLVIEKEAEMARSRDELDVGMQESIECIPKTYLEDIRTETSTLQLGNESLRIISVGELLSLLEV